MHGCLRKLYLCSCFKQLYLSWQDHFFEARRRSRAALESEDDNAEQDQDLQEAGDEERDGVEGRAGAPEDSEEESDAEDGEQDRGDFSFDIASKSNRNMYVK